MTTTALTPTLRTPLIDRLLPVPNVALRTIVQVVLGVILLAALAQVRVVIGPVPITGQTFGVLLLAAVYGRSLGALTIVAYLSAGLAGLGVFTGGVGGLAVLSGTTVGYLAGFVPAALVVGFLAQRGWDRSFRSTAAAMVLGNAIIYLGGVTWLLRFAPDLQTALAWGLWPFIAGDLIKLAFAAALVPAAWRLLRR
ncbi:biotin transporter BioY [soil metagenome]|nr:biotin transporter BioY [Trueperaceae bacterium]